MDILHFTRPLRDIRAIERYHALRSCAGQGIVRLHIAKCSECTLRNVELDHHPCHTPEKCLPDALHGIIDGMLPPPFQQSNPWFICELIDGCSDVLHIVHKHLMIERLISLQWTSPCAAAQGAVH
jgi:hypothetical protein